MGPTRRPAAVLLLLLASACATAPAPSPTTFTKPFAFAILEDYDKGAELREVEADFRLMNDLGIATWRGSFGWDDYEPAPGRYDFAWLHQFAALAAHHHLALRPYLGYTPAWAARAGGADAAAWNDPPASLAAWRQFVLHLTAAMQVHPNVLSFEIYNEENAPLWWDGTAADYSAVLSHGSDAVRRAAPGTPVLLGGLTFPDLDWMEALCARHGNGDDFDVLPIHAYAETWGEPGVAIEDYLDAGYFHGTFLAEVDRTCGPKPIWINEAGFATTPGQKNERDQANWWARAIATFAAEPRVEALGIYELKDQPPASAVIGEPENYHLGLTYPDRRKKLAYYTVQRLVALLDVGRLTVADDEAALTIRAGAPGDLHHHLFILPDRRQVLILWDRRGTPQVEVRLRRRAAAVTEYGLDGRPRRRRDFDPQVLHDLRLAPGEVRVFEFTP